jgi:sterol desaturase/sphingolipid hydroxylase (fatty acid hydroxylase superfamily)
MKLLSDFTKRIAFPFVVALFLFLLQKSFSDSPYDEMHALTHAYFPCLLLILALEFLIPYERQWNSPSLDKRVDDYPVIQDIGHTIVVAITVALLREFFVSVFDHFGYVSPFAEFLNSLPFWCSFPLGTMIAEFGLYWHHRFNHTFAFLWFDF